jgi:hypothetical protein
VRRARTVVVALVVGILATGCATTPSPAPSTPSSPDPATSFPLPTLATPQTAPGAVVVDAGLLDLLPATVAGIDRLDDLETATEIAASGALAGSVAALATALYAGADDYATVSIVRPSAGVFDAAWFRDWRDTFDAGVCEQAGGVDTGRSEVDIAGRTTHRATCAGGVVILHQYLPGRDVVVSVQGAGPGGLGEQILAELEE